MTVKRGVDEKTGPVKGTLDMKQTIRYENGKFDESKKKTEKDSSEFA
jgi:hypothetical protein